MYNYRVWDTHNKTELKSHIQDEALITGCRHDNVTHARAHAHAHAAIQQLTLLFWPVMKEHTHIKHTPLQSLAHILTHKTHATVQAFTTVMMGMTHHFGEGGLIC